MISKGLLCFLCFDVSKLEKWTIPGDNFNKLKLENIREHVECVKSKGIENTLNIVIFWFINACINKYIEK